MLKVGGIYVSPFEVEGALASHDAVLESAVVGAEDEAKLIKPKAFVVLKPGHGRSPALADGAARTMSNRGSRRISIRAGSNSSTTCPRPRPAKSSGSSCDNNGGGR